MKVNEEQKRKILFGAKTVLSEGDVLSPDFIHKKLDGIKEVLMSEAGSDSGQKQEIVPEAFTEGLEDLSEAMSHSERYKL